MTIHMHALPVSPNSELYRLAGEHFLVSHATTAKAQMRIADQIGQSVLIDPGAFTYFQRLKKDIAARRAGSEFISTDAEHEMLHAPRDWRPYYEWVDPWLNRPTTHAIIPDVIEASSQTQDALLAEWPFGAKGWPVFHIAHNEERLFRLLEKWPVVCMGSSEEYWQVLSPVWQRRMDFLWNEIEKRCARTPKIHGLRMMQLCVEGRWPFYSIDSSDVGQNHNRDGNDAVTMARRPMPAALHSPRRAIGNGGMTKWQEHEQWRAGERPRQKSIYLCGPINGCTDEECTNWREDVKAQWPGRCIDPMVRDYRGREAEAFREIVELDKIDVAEADIILVNYDKPSVGTSMEVLYAWERGKRVIVVCREEAVISPWLRYHAHHIAHSFDEAMSIASTA